MEKTDPCVCDSGKPFGQCCRPFLENEKRPRTPKQLMRSRYSAYALGGYSDYLLSTWHPRVAPRINRADLETDDYQWLGLEVDDVTLKGDRAMVEFRARFREGDGPEQVHHERSAFMRHKGVWYYLDGEVKTASA